MTALRAAFPSMMAQNALESLRVARVDAAEVELCGSAGAVQFFRSRVDEVSRVLSGAFGRRLRAVLTPEGVPVNPEAEAAQAPPETDTLKDHPLVQAASRAFNAEVARVAPRVPEQRA